MDNNENQNLSVWQNQKIIEMQQAAQKGSRSGSVDQSDIFRETVNKYDGL